MAKCVKHLTEGDVSSGHGINYGAFNLPPESNFFAYLKVILTHRGISPCTRIAFFKRHPYASLDISTSVAPLLSLDKTAAHLVCARRIKPPALLQFSLRREINSQLTNGGNSKVNSVQNRNRRP